MGGTDFRRQKSGFSCGRVTFEVSIKLPSGDVENAVGFKSFEFGESLGNISLG